MCQTFLTPLESFALSEEQMGGWGRGRVGKREERTEWDLGYVCKMR